MLERVVTCVAFRVKGLNVIKTVVDLKGMKRFKKSKDASDEISVDMDVNFA